MNGAMRFAYCALVLVAFGDPKQALAPVHVVRKPLEEILKSLHGEGPLAPERERLEIVRAQVAVAGAVVLARRMKETKGK
jgi:hypothetical protein